MALEIKDSTKKKVAKAPSRVIKSGDEDYDKIRKQVCDVFIATRNQTEAYDLFRRATMGDDYVKISTGNSSASVWFSKAENQNYIEFRKVEIAKIGFDEYCRLKNIEHSEFNEIEAKKYNEVLTRTPAEVRNETLKVLEMVIETTQDDIIRLSATKQRTELTDAKFKDKSTELSESAKFIHFYLPAPVCDSCPNRKDIEERFKDMPEIELEVDDDEIVE